MNILSYLQTKKSRNLLLIAFSSQLWSHHNGDEKTAQNQIWLGPLFGHLCFLFLLAGRLRISFGSPQIELFLDLRFNLVRVREREAEEEEGRNGYPKKHQLPSTQSK